MNNKNNTEGFSLLELSIVLVIIGLIAGGITVGADMVRAAELRSVMTDVEKYKTAVYAFKDKYMALPGDMKNATSFWGAAHATPATCTTTVGTGTQTCDGDGDGLIDVGGEMFRFWQQLSNAGLIEGTFSGVTGPSTGYSHVIGQNCPASRLSATGFTAVDGGSGGGVYYSGVYGNTFQFGGVVTGTFSNVAAISPEDAWSIDTKFDDGKPGQGEIVAYRSGWNPGCATTDVEATAAYNLTNVSKLCSFAFKNSF